MATDMDREIMNLPGLDDVEFRSTWHHASGQLSAYRHCILILNEQASKLFIRHQDDHAELLRGLSDEISKYAMEQMRLKDACITEDLDRAQRQTR